MNKILILICFVSVAIFGYEKDVNIGTPTDAYITDEQGNVFIYLNIIGHVKTPGSYLVYEGADILTILSQAGGPMPGAKLSDIVIYSKDSDKIKINLDSYIKNSLTQKNSSIKLKPNDTIYIKQKFTSAFFTNSNIVSSFLQILNIALTIENNK